MTIELESRAETTHLALSQDNNPTEEARQRSEKNWSSMPATLKQVPEG